MTAAFHAGFFQAAMGVLKDPTSIPYVCISPQPLGNQSGDDWDNAAPLSALNTMVLKAALMGGEVRLRADIGTYTRTTPLSVGAGGTAGQRVVIRGTDVSGNDMMAEIIGNRASPWSKGSVDGQPLITLNTGANYTTWRMIRGRNLGRGMFRFRQPTTSTVIEDVEFYNVNTFIANDGVTSAADATINGITVRRVNGHGWSKTFCRIEWNSSNILFEDCVGDAERQDRDNFCTGLKFDDTAHDIIVRRCTMGNIIDTYNVYQNGDGYASERGNYNLLFEDCMAHHCTDGGWDCKSDNLVIRRCTAYMNHRNFRLWGYALLEDCISIEPYDNAGKNPYAQYHFAGYSSSMVELRNCRAEATTSKATIFTAEGGGIVSYDSDCTWSVPAGTPVSFAEGSNNGNPAGFVGTRPANTDAPIITTPAQYSTDENVAAKWTMQANRMAQLRVVGGRDRARFNVFGQELRINRQDYEKLPDPNLQVTIQMKDMAGNLSAAKQLVVSINDVADDPITPAELFGPNGATAGCWFEILPENCFTDAAGTIPCQDGDPIMRINDLSGLGNHAIAYNPDFTWTLIQEADRWYAEAPGGLECYKIGGNGALSQPVITAVIALRRDAQDLNPRTFFTIPRYFTADVSNNHRFRIYVAANSGTNFGASFNGQNNYTDSTVAAPIGKDAVLSARSAPAIVRGNAVQLRDGTDVPSLIYASNGPAIWGGKSTGDETIAGRVYGLVVTNREEGDAMNYRIERQLGLLASMNL